MTRREGGDATREPAQGLEARALLEQVRGSMFGRTPDTMIGRFRVHGVLGRGAFGSVLDASDPSLGRRVAIKVLRRAASDGPVAEANLRMLREARALARLSHANVVPIFAVGEHEERVWFAMERVDGRTLAQWSAENPAGSTKRFREALRLILQAGRGLAAAHAAGLLHRDFKPANVLVGDDGRVRVADFGLVREDATASRPEAEPDGSQRSTIRAQSGPALDLTRTGAAMGTPAYMAPEQLRGERLDPRCDQFSFAVSAWEVLHGQPAFEGRTPAALERAIGRGPRPPASTASVPVAVQRCLRRALAYAPGDRFASMAALLGALEAAGRRRYRAQAAAVVGLGAIGALAMAVQDPDPSGPVCDGEAARAEAAASWATPRREAVANALRTHARAYAEPMLASIDRELAAFADDYARGSVDACRAAWHDGSIDARTLDERVACLRDRLAIADSVLARLETANAGMAERAVSIVEGLPSPRDCADHEADPGPPNPEASELRALLREARADLLAEEAERAEQVAAQISQRARAAGLDQILGDALAIEVRARDVALERNDVRGMEEAYEIALASGDDDRALHRALMLASYYGATNRIDDANKWLRHAEAAMARAAEPGGANEAALETARCFVLGNEGRHSEAIAACERAASIAHDPASGPVSAGLRERIGKMLGVSYYNRNRYDEANRWVHKVRGDAVYRLGAHHPDIATLDTQLSWIALGRGEVEDAVRLARSALEVRLASRGPEDLFLITIYESLGEALSAAQDFEAAEDAYDHGLAVARANPSGDATNDAVVLAGRRLSLAILWLRQDARRGEGIELLVSLDRELRPLLPEHAPDLVAIDKYLGRGLVEAGRYAEADAPLARAEAMLRRDEDPELSDTLIDRAVVAEATGNRSAARAIYRDAIVVAGAGAPSAAVLAAARLAALEFRADRAVQARAWLEMAELLAPGARPSSSCEAALDLARAWARSSTGDDDGARAIAGAALERIEASHDLDAREQERRLRRFLER